MSIPEPRSASTRRHHAGGAGVNTREGTVVHNTVAKDGHAAVAFAPRVQSTRPAALNLDAVMEGEVEAAGVNVLEAGADQAHTKITDSAEAAPLKSEVVLMTAAQGR